MKLKKPMSDQPQENYTDKKYEDIVEEFQETIACHLTCEPSDINDRVSAEAFYVCIVRAIIKERNFYQAQADKCNRLLELIDAEKLANIIDFDEN